MSDFTLVSHHLCPYVQRAVIALAEKKQAFDRVTIDLDAKPDWFTALSPLGKVPLLQLAGRLTHHVHILEMNGESYRLAQSKRRARPTKLDTPTHDTEK